MHAVITSPMPLESLLLLSSFLFTLHLPSTWVQNTEQFISFCPQNASWMELCGWGWNSIKILSDLSWYSFLWYCSSTGSFSSKMPPLLTIFHSNVIIDLHCLCSCLGLVLTRSSSLRFVFERTFSICMFLTPAVYGWPGHFQDWLCCVSAVSPY